MDISQMKCISFLPYAAILFAMAIFNILVLATPFIAMQDTSAADALYLAFAPTCHQLTARSLCLFEPNDGGMPSIGDCMVADKLILSRENVVSYPDKTGYKLPVCSRDTAIYLAMLLGLAILPFIRKIESEDLPPFLALAIAAVPIGIDGTAQLAGLYESTNAIRIATGAIIGLVLPFYLVPMLNSILSLVREKFAKTNKKNGN